MSDQDKSLFGALIEGIADAAEATVRETVTLPGKLVRGVVEGTEKAAEAVTDALEGRKE